MKSAERDQALDLRIRNQLGYSEIAKRLHVSKSTLSRWLADLPLSDERILELRRAGWSRGEAKRERFRNTMRAKRARLEQEVYTQQKKVFAHISEGSLFIAGLMLYVAEGDKKSSADIAFTNTDPMLVSFFAWWIVRFLKLPKEKLRIQLHLYENMDVKAEELFWRKQLGLTQAQLWKSQIRPLRLKSFSYRESFRHGTCKLYIGSVPKKTELKLSIRAFFDTYDEHLRV
jgi:transcriptional regulator with XRE-family HTH domain